MELTLEDLWRELADLRFELVKGQIANLEVLALLKQMPTLDKNAPIFDRDIDRELAKAHLELAQIGASRAHSFQKVRRSSI